MPLNYSAPSPELDVELNEVRSDAAALSELFKYLNTPLPDSFPKAAILELANGLQALPDGTARGCLRPLTEAQAQLATIRSQYVIHEVRTELRTSEAEPPLFRGEPLDQKLRNLMSSVSTALQTANRLGAEESDVETPEESVKPSSDAPTATLVQASINLQNELDQERQQLDAVRVRDSKRADTLRRRVTDVLVLNWLGRGELRMPRMVSARLRRLANSIREYPALIEQSADLIVKGSDVADYAFDKWHALKERIFKAGTQTIREIAEDVRRFAERLEPSLSADSETAKGKGRDREPLDPAVDLLSAEHMIARGETPPSEVIPYVTSFDKSDLEQRAIAALGQMTELRILRLKGSPGITEIAPLAKLSSLQLLSLENTQIVEIEPLAKLSTLKTINLSGTKVRDIKPLEALFALQSIDLSRTQVRDLEPLLNLTALTALYLSNTPVSDLKPLANLSKLQTIDLLGTKVADLKPLIKLSAVRELYISDTMVSDLTPLAKLSALQALSLANTDVHDLRPLAHLPALQTIILSRTKIWDVRVLGKLPSLQSIVLNETKVRDLKPLAGLSQLQTISLHNTQVIDLSPLRDLPRLQKINIPENKLLIATLGLPVRREYDAYEVKRD